MNASVTDRKILFIAHEFPPLNRGGTQRPLRFARHLPDFGVNPFVLTVDPAYYGNIFGEYHCDESTLESLRVSITRTDSKKINLNESGRFARFIGIYFNPIGREAEAWKDFFMPAAEKLIKDHELKAVCVTAPPCSVIFLAVKIAQKFKLPLIVDMRDAWSQWILGPYATYFHYLAVLMCERYFLKKAAAVICTSDQIMYDFQRIHPRIEKAKYHVITNSYDGIKEDWSSVNEKKSDQKFIVGYVGSYYYDPNKHKKMFQSRLRKRGHHFFEYVPRKENWLYRTPFFFFKSLNFLFKKSPALKQKIYFHHAGSVPDWLNEMAEEFGLLENLKCLGRLDLVASRRFQSECDALLLTSSKVEGGEDYSIAGKTFEYIYSGRPIVSFACEGAQKRILENTGITLLCDPDNMESSAEQIRKLVSNEIMFNPKTDFLKTLSVKEKTRDLSKVILNTIDNYDNR